ncbi:MAG: recombinase family protein [Solirubrobacterales bacterium]|nr:recombinase family protein [Solirubrobacterales bacterium]
MSTFELVTSQHLARKAIIYIRQSTPQQVLSNQESLRLQYALQQRALHLGWPREAIEIIDADLGLTASGAHPRPGFADLVAKVTLGEVGLILSFDVTRLARNCSEWYPLLDLCGYKHCLIGDHETLYDPTSPNGRLLLGLKGQLSEHELHILRTRLTAGLLNKAQRGELAVRLPAGLIRDEHGRALKDPNREVQDRIDLIFTTFLHRRSASQVLRFLRDHSLFLPRRDRFGDLVWKEPSVSAILAILKNPAYAGAFVYGRTRQTTKSSVPPEAGPQRLPMEQWKICVKDIYPPYISWETFEHIQGMLHDNYAEYTQKQTRGIPRAGAALLHGIIYCGECGHKLIVQYTGKTYYVCNFLRTMQAAPLCQKIPAAAIDAWVVEAFFQALAPVELDAYAAAIAAQQESEACIRRAHNLHLERLGYEASLAERQFNRADPDNRLVTATLEHRWEAALQAVERAKSELQTREQQVVSAQLSDELKATFSAIGQHLPQIWQDPVLTQPQRKALLRCLVDKVVVHRSRRDTVTTRIVWRGGATTTHEIGVTVGALADLTRSADFEQATVELSLAGVADEEIAEQLTQQGYRSPMRSYVLTSTVKVIRRRHGVFQERSQSHPRHLVDFLSVSQVAVALGVSPHWVYDRIYNGTIQVSKDATCRAYWFPDTPATLEQFKALKAGQRPTITFDPPQCHLD